VRKGQQASTGEEGKRSMLFFVGEKRDLFIHGVENKEGHETKSKGKWSWAKGDGYLFSG